MANDTIIDTNLNEQEKVMFNSQFMQYDGENIRGSIVNAMISSVKTNNLTYQGEIDRTVKVTLDGIETMNNVQIDKFYTVEVIYNEEGFVSEMKVTTNN